MTNGVHLQTWIAPRIRRMLDEHLGTEWREHQEDPDIWRGVRGIPDDVFWHAHSGRKRRLLDILSERLRQRWVNGGEAGQVLSGGPFLEEKVLTIGFARRFATYKRATLLFHDVDRLASILNNPDRPVQIVFSGKAHPADDGGKHLIRELIWRRATPNSAGGSRLPRVRHGRGVAARSGVDVWLNNPQTPMEASGTSGMKAWRTGCRT